MKLQFQALRQAVATASFPDSDIEKDVMALLHDLHEALKGIDFEELGIISDDVLNSLDDKAKSLLHTIHVALLEEEIIVGSDVITDLDEETDDLDIGRKD